MIRNLEVNESKIIDLNQRKRQMQRKAKLEREKRARQKFRTRVGIAAFALAIPALAVAHNNLTKATEPDVAIENEVTDDTIYADITDLNDIYKSFLLAIEQNIDTGNPIIILGEDIIKKREAEFKNIFKKILHSSPSIQS